MTDDPIAKYEADWARRKAISNKYGHGSIAVAAIAFVLYIVLESILPENARPETGHVFRVFYVGRTYGHGPTFVFGTQWEQWLSIATGAVAITFALAGAVVYYIYNPGAFYREVRSNLRD